MSVLLSIKPKYVDKIRNGTKLYEFRKQIFKQDAEEIWVYESAPVKKIVGKIVISNVIEDSPKNLWSNTKEFAGINKKDFFKYFGSKDKGFAIGIKEFYELKNPINPYEIKKRFVPPQSFAYIESIKELKEQLEFA